ncbi:MAG: excinuclease ABC subunit UvrC [Christensenellales bacterium]|jgi:excinuclease ABC subunit C
MTYTPELTRAELIDQQLQMLPDSPGVYLMKDADGSVIYIGKSVSLKNRVRQYFHASRSHSPKVQAMVERIHRFDYILCANEMEAFILENNLIKQYRPYYNNKLKDDKNYPYVRIDMSQSFPRVEITRKMRRDKARYFGPYMSTKDVRAALDVVRRVFPVRTCARDLERIRAGNRPCLNAQIGRCLGPCTGQVKPEEYKAVMRQVIRFLEGREDEIIAEVTTEMQEAAASLRFERAAVLRDRKHALERISASRQNAVSTLREDWDIFGIHRGESLLLFQLLVVRGGILTGSDSATLEDWDETASDGALLGDFVREYYAAQAYIPPLILVPSLPPDAETLNTWLTGLRGAGCMLHKPERGEKRKLVEMAVRNAAQAEERLRLARDHAWARTGGALRVLAETLGLAAPPRRIEAYDISNIQGTLSVASMVVMEEGEPARDQYRRFRIKTVEGADDFASMAEVIQRRFRHAREETETIRAAGGDLSKGKFTRMPDLVLIDGGPVQLAFARQMMDEAGFSDCPAVSLAKREEEIYTVGQPDPIRLKKTDPALHLLQRIRDEAHRFAISYHRSLRGYKTLSSWLDSVEGIGPARRKALLRSYPSRSAMAAATLEELASLPGMNRPAAEAVYSALHSDDSPTTETEEHPE